MWIFFLALAAITDAIMDTLKDHYDVSVFHGFNKYFWNPLYSWNYHKKFLGIEVLDAWHISKGLMQLCLFLTIVFYKPILPYYLDVPCMFIYWGIWFELFYSKLLKL